MNKQLTNISNKVNEARKDLTKLEYILGKRYATHLEVKGIPRPTKKEFYMETLLSMLLESQEQLEKANDLLELAKSLLEEHSPVSLAEMVAKDGVDYKEASMSLKVNLLEQKLGEDGIEDFMNLLSIANMLNK